MLQLTGLTTAFNFSPAGITAGNQND